MARYGIVTVLLTVVAVTGHQRLLVAAQTGCSIPLSTIFEDSPITLYHSQQNGMSQFRTPSNHESKSLTFSRGEAVRFACPDGDDNLLMIPNSPLMVYEVIAFCMSDSTFSISGAPYHFSSLRCKNPPQSAVKEEGRCDIGNGHKFNIGFKLRRKFIGLIEVCYDNKNQSALNSRYTLSKSIGTQNGAQRNSHYYVEITKTPEDLYNCKNQVKNLGRILSSQEQAKKYLNCDYRSYSNLGECHLAPSTDFVFEYQKRAVAYYINTAPQWQNIHLGNWEVLEGRVRRYASVNNVDLTVVTGTLNVATLPDVTGREQQLYLSRDEMQHLNRVPVPALFWKLVYNRAKNAGIVFVVVNDPYHHNFLQHGYVICTNICEGTVSWFDGWNRMDVSNGFVYCCAVNDFRAKSGINPFPYKAKYVLR